MHYVKHWLFCIIFFFLFRFKTHINSNPVAAVLSTEELLKLQSEVAAAPPGVAALTETKPAQEQPGNYS